MIGDVEQRFHCNNMDRKSSPSFSSCFQVSQSLREWVIYPCTQQVEIHSDHPHQHQKESYLYFQHHLTFLGIRLYKVDIKTYREISMR